MILQSLHTLYDRLALDPDYGVAEPGFSQQKLSFVVVLALDGILRDIRDEREETVVPSKTGKTKTVKQSKLRVVPGQAKPPGSGINPCFLWDNTTYMLGYHTQKDKEKDKDKDKEKQDNPARTQSCFDAFRARHLEIETEIDDPGFSAVCRFLESWHPERAGAFPILKEFSTGFGVFRLQGETTYVHDRPAIQAWFRRKKQGSAGREVGSGKGMCLISGLSEQPLARLHEPKIKGVLGTQGAGAPLVSFNCEAFSSYAKKQSFNAPVSQPSTFRYCTALNALLDGPLRERHRFFLAGDTVVFWTAEKTVTEGGIARFFSGSMETPKPKAQDGVTLEKVGGLLTALRQGSGHLEILGDNPATPFYVLGLSPNAGRISVRYWHVSTLGDFIDRLRNHFKVLKIIPQYGPDSKRPDPEFIPFWQLLKETARESKDIPPFLGGALMRAILGGGPYPNALAIAIIRRIRADRIINYPRAALLKAWLTRSPQWKGELPVSLDTDRAEPAYRMGRLFAALEKTQEEALPGINATVRDRFFGAASATPGVVMPRLLRTYQHHLAKLNPGAKVNRERLVQQILEGVHEIPKSLTLEEQGLFAIGYYHQRQSYFTSKAQN